MHVVELTVAEGVWLPCFELCHMHASPLVAAAAAVEAVAQVPLVAPVPGQVGPPVVPVNFEPPRYALHTDAGYLSKPRSLASYSAAYFTAIACSVVEETSHFPAVFLDGTSPPLVQVPQTQETPVRPLPVIESTAPLVSVGHQYDESQAQLAVVAAVSQLVGRLVSEHGQLAQPVPAQAAFAAAIVAAIKIILMIFIQL